MNVDRDSAPQAAYFVPHGADRAHAPSASAGNLPPPPADEAVRYPWPVRVAIMLLGGGALWGGLIWAGWRWLR